MNGSGYFERLVASVEKIARHAYYPGIDEAITHCLDDVAELHEAGLITLDQHEALRFVLLGISVNKPAKATAA